MALLLHAAVVGGCIWLVRPSVLSAPMREQAVEWVFAAAEPVPPPAAERPDAAAPEPPLQQAVIPPVPEPQPLPPPPQQAEAAPTPPPPPAQQAETMQPEPPRAQAEQEVPKEIAPAKPVPAVRHAPPRPIHMAKPAPSRAPAAHETAAVPPATTPAPGDDPSVLVAWERSVSAWLATHRVYPYEARRRGEEGSVELRFTADRDGRVSDIALVRSAGSPVLDNAAQATVRDATLPPFSPGMSQKKITVTVQIRYALRN
ncbi:MAG TPA: energy transducer TonB [Rhodopila sp.]|nr:energy transducer TonB [Rhodopila sp.]